VQKKGTVEINTNFIFVIHISVHHDLPMYRNNPFADYKFQNE
jgi:hypothetical protein